jgi:tetratricopeptide (TPR) repeat protein/Leucine-rich repeat (LRR) protein
MTVTNLFYEIATSSEFIHKFEQVSPSERAEYLYLRLLDRHVDPLGKSIWGNITTDMEMVDVASIIGSREFGDRIMPRLLEPSAIARENGLSPRARLAAINELLARNPSDTSLILERAVTLIALGKYRSAIKDLDRAIAANKSDVRAYMARINAHQCLNEQAKVKADLDSALNLLPNDPELYVQRAISQGLCGEYEAAMRDLTRAEKLGRRAEFERAEIYYMQGRYELAVRELSSFLARKPSVSAYAIRGDCYFKLGNFKAAVPDLRKATKSPKTPGFSGSLQMLKKALSFTGESRATKVLHFNERQSLGRVYLCDGNNDVLVGAAFGTVSIPDGFKVGLSLNNNALAAGDSLVSLPNEVAAIDLTGTKVTDEWLPHLLAFRQLEKLDLSATNISDKGLGILRDLPNLTELDLSQTMVRGENLDGFKHLRWLILSKSELSDLGVTKIATLKEMRHLDLDNTKVTDRGLQALARLQALQYLDLGNTKIANQAFSSWSKRTEIKFLNLAGTATDDRVRPLLTLSPFLESLDLSETAITDVALKSIHPSVKILKLARNSNLSDAALPAIGNLPQLTTLDLSFTKLSPGRLKVLGRLKKLESLNLSGLKVEDEDLVFVSQLRSLSKLLLGGSALDALALMRIVKLPALRELDLTGAKIDDRCLPILAGASQLRMLDLSATKISQDGIENLRRKLTDCQINGGVGKK